MAGSLGDLGGLLRQAQKMQRQVQELQEELSKRHFEGVAGNGLVRAVVSGARDLVSIRIAPEAVDPSDLSLLEDLVTVAVKEALRKAEAESSSAMKKVTGGLGLPGLQ